MIKRNGTQASNKGSAENFTGNVRVDPLFHAPGPAQFGGASVSFEPGARSAWHTHPCGQTLIVTSGRGATATTGMTHIAIQESRDGKNVEWLEHVTDEQYRG